MLVFSSLIIIGCVEEKPASHMPVTTDSELALEFYETGQMAYDQLKLSVARKNFENAVEEDSNFFMAYFWMFFIASKDSKNISNKAFKVEAQLNPGEEQVRLALKYLMDGQHEKVEEHLSNAIDLYPADPNLHKILYIIQFHYFKNPEAAIVSIDRAIKECPDFPLAYNQLGYAYSKLEEYEKAEEALDNYIRLAPDQGNPYDSKGDFFMTTKQFEKAYESYMKAYEIDPYTFEVSKKKAKKARMLQEKANHQ